MTQPSCRAIAFIGILLPLASCQWIGNTADSIGEHLPVIGERCESAQCFTESGRQRSDAIKAEKLRQRQTPAPATEPATPPQDDYPATPQHPAQ